MAAPSDTLDVRTLIDGRPVSRLQIRIFVLCGLAMLIDGYDIQAIGLALPGLAEDWGMPPQHFSSVLAASVVGIAFGGIVLAPLADRLGRRPLLIGSMVLLGIGTLGTALSTSLLDLLLWRTVTGVALGGSVPVAFAMTSEFAPARRRAAIVLLTSCAMPIGSVAGSVLAPIIDAIWGWRGILAIGGAAPLGIAVLFWILLPESLQLLVKSRPGDPRIAPTARAIAPEVDAASLRVTEQDGVRGTVIALLSRTLRVRTGLFWLVCSANVFINYYMISWLPTLLGQQGWPPEAALSGASFYAAGGLLGGLGLAWLIARWNPVTVLTVSYGVTALSFAAFLFMPDHRPIWSALLLVAGSGGHGGALAILALVSSSYPSAIGATAVGWAGSVARLGGIAAPLAGGALLGFGWTTPHVMSALLVPALICVLGIALLPRAMRSTSGTRPAGSATPRLKGR